MINGLVALLNYFQRERHHKEPGADEVLKQLLEAIRETTNYLDQHYNKGNRDQDVEFKLCKLWEESALSLRRYDKDLADRCLLKGMYWNGGGEMISVKENRIKIEEMRAGFQSLFDEI